MRNIFFHLEELIKDRNVIMLAHYYKDLVIQDVADFMGETVKILNPEKTFSLCILDDGVVYNKCPQMQLNTFEKNDFFPEKMAPKINIPEDLRLRALKPLEKMLALS